MKPDLQIDALGGGEDESKAPSDEEQNAQMVNMIKSMSSKGYIRSNIPDNLIVFKGRDKSAVETQTEPASLEMDSTDVFQ